MTEIFTVGCSLPMGGSQTLHFFQVRAVQHPQAREADTTQGSTTVTGLSHILLASGNVLCSHLYFKLEHRPCSHDIYLTEHTIFEGSWYSVSLKTILVILFPLGSEICQNGKSCYILL